MKRPRTEIIFFDSIDSTNSYINSQLQTNPLSHGFCVCSGFQTAGRGQAGNTWESCRGDNLLFSILLHTEKFPLINQFLLSEVVSVAICNVLRSKGIEVEIKYPNDIFWKDKKIAGILIENRVVGSVMKYSIVGIGLNVNQEEFVRNALSAVSMRNITGKMYDLKALLLDFVGQIIEAVDEFDIADKERWKSLYFGRLYRKDGFFAYEADGKRFNAKILDIADNGRLHLLTDSGETRKFYFKEVRFII